MGQLMETELVVATLNYSGILLSPFQFYSEEQKKTEYELSRIFQRLTKSKYPDYDRKTFKWNIGKIDQKIQRERYSPLYRQNAGILNGRMLNDQEFREQWKKQFAEARKSSNIQIQQAHQQNCLEFDLICYKTIFFSIYHTEDLKQAKFKPVKDYEKFMRKMFSKAFLDEQKKIDKALAAIYKEEVDIVFFQESDDTIARSFDNKIFKVVCSETKQCLIAIRKSKFKNIYDEKSVLQGLGEQIRKQLTWNNDLCVAFADNLILISAHLSSKAEKQEKDRQAMFKGCQRLLTIYPNSHLILGVDANQYIKNVPSSLHVFPTRKNVNTSYKKRTMMQPQVQKGEQEIEKTIDFLITDLNMRKPKVVSILGKQANVVGYLPCQEHPYDHFVVTANIYTHQI